MRTCRIPVVQLVKFECEQCESLIHGCNRGGDENSGIRSPAPIRISQVMSESKLYHAQRMLLILTAENFVFTHQLKYTNPHSLLPDHYQNFACATPKAVCA